jgi:hypothetical protein
MVFTLESPMAYRLARSLQQAGIRRGRMQLAQCRVSQSHGGVLDKRLPSGDCQDYRAAVHGSLCGPPTASTIPSRLAHIDQVVECCMPRNRYRARVTGDQREHIDPDQIAQILIGLILQDSDTADPVLRSWLFVSGFAWFDRSDCNALTKRKRVRISVQYLHRIEHRERWGPSC